MTNFFSDIKAVVLILIGCSILGLVIDSNNTSIEFLILMLFFAITCFFYFTMTKLEKIEERNK